MFCMYMCSKICVPLVVCWLCQPRLFHSNINVVWDVGTKCFCVFHVGSKEDICVERSHLVNHIENNLKRPMVLMRMRSEQSNPERFVVFD